MNDAVAHLAHIRQVVAEREDTVAGMETALHASPLWERLEEGRLNLRQARLTQTDAETEVRKQALGIYEETGDKHPHPAVPIKMYTVLDYDDGEALDYAREHLSKALKLIKRTFEKAAKVLELDFVTIRQEPRATIRRDLSEYLPTGEK